MSGENVFSARVARVSFLGAGISCELAVGDFALRVDLPARERIAEGDLLCFRVDPADIVLVAEDDG
jgi:hypothetical protein